MRSPFFSSKSVLSFVGGLVVFTLMATGCSLVTAADDGPSEAYKLQLATHLTEQGASMYGAFWCPHCARQKALFGEAVGAIPYIECDSEGENAQPQLCQTKEIEGYPTWEINSEFYPGVHSLTQLAALSQFQNE